VTFRAFDDIPGQRQAVYDSVFKSVQSTFPLKNATHQLDVSDLKYEDYNPTKADEKKAVLTDGRMLRKLQGKIKLTDLTTGKVLDEQSTTLAHVPHMTNRGTFLLDGTSWIVRNQARLRPGVYVRRQKSGGTEAHFNVKPGTGRGYRVELEPESGLFKLNVGQSTTRLYPILRAMGIQDDDLKKAWGDELFKKNYRKLGAHDISDIKKVAGKLGREGVEITDDMAPKVLQELLSKHEFDEDTTELTLGSRRKNLDTNALVQVTQKILKVARDEDPGDNRDSQAFQSIHSAEDFFADRVRRDPTNSLRKLLWKAGKTGKIGATGGIFSQALRSLFNGTGLAATPEETNELEIADLRNGVTRMGEGGISDTSAVSRDAKGIQTSYLGLIDPSRSPESLAIGLDLRLSRNAVKGSDNQLYTQMRNAKTGKMEFVPARNIERSVIAFPGELTNPGKRIRGVKDGKVQYVHRDEVTHELAHGIDMMSAVTAMVPFPQAMKGQRLSMAARMTSQALPLRDAEAPLVQGALPDGTSLHDAMSSRAGAVKADKPGQVIKVEPDQITVQTSEGVKTYELYNHYPGSRKTFLHNTPAVKPGDVVAPGQVLARSNMTDSAGKVAIGRNLRVGYLSAKAGTHEDGIVISESAAKKLASEQAYQMELDGEGVESTDKDRYVAVYGPRFTKDQYAKLGTDGVIKPGTIVKSGDPLILAVGKKDGRAVGAVMKTAKSGSTDRSVVWEHDADGEVVDIKNTKGGMTVFVKSYTPAVIGDKASGRHGNKGIISEIRPDAQMPHDEQGRPLEILLNPVGVISRVNASVLVESLLGKVAEKTGKPYVVAPFSHDNAAEFALGEAAKHGIKETETVVDPETGRQIPNVFVGNQYIMKLHHLAEAKLSARDQASYDSFDAPAKGGPTGAKRLSMLGLHSLVSAGATEFIKDAKLVRGQRNDEYWRSIREGVEPLQPAKSFANDHFKSLLKGAGVNIREQGTKSRLRPLLDKDVDEIAQHEIENSETFDQDMKPVPGGLFDLGKTGGADGTRFSYIKLPAKIPHPMFAEPIARVLGLTIKGMDAVLAGKQELHGKTGPEAIEGALSDVNIQREIDRHKQTIKTGSSSKRDAAVRALGFLEGFKRMEVKPADLMISKIPVVPPKFRPISRTPKMDVIHDLNHLYHDLFEAKKNYKDTDDKLGDAGDQYLTMVQAAKAVVGTDDPVNPKHVEQQLKGLLGFAIGIGDTPKAAAYQRRVLGMALDTVGRSTITTGPELDMDQIGVPKRMAWEVYRPYIIRRLVRNGTPATEAVMAVRNQTKAAEHALSEEIKVRPVMYNRDPALHRYSMQAGWPVLHDGDSIRYNSSVMTDQNADIDGDQVNIHVPNSDAAVKDILENLLPSRNIISSSSFDVHHDPKQDYVAGLYLAGKPDMSRPVKEFATQEDAIKAYKAGKLSARDPVRILSNSK
jgi:DNA-directed RNA polymerase beta subunit